MRPTSSRSPAPRAADRRHDPLVLGDDVLGAAGDRLRQHVAVPAQRGAVQVAQRRDRGHLLRQQGHGAAAFGAALAKGGPGLGRLGRRAGIADDDPHARRQDHVSALEGAAVEQDRPIGAARGTGELIHDPAVDAEEVALGALGQGRQRRRRHEALAGEQGHGRGQLQRRDRAEAGAAVGWRSRRRHRSHGPGARLRAATRPCRRRSRSIVARRGHRARARRPRRPAAHDEFVDPELGPLGRLQRHDAHQPVASRAGGDPGVQLDRRRQDQPVVVVGVIADQVHPARGPHELDLVPRRVGRVRKRRHQRVLEPPPARRFACRPASRANAPHANRCAFPSADANAKCRAAACRARRDASGRTRRRSPGATTSPTQRQSAGDIEFGMPGLRWSRVPARSRLPCPSERPWMRSSLFWR